MLILVISLLLILPAAAWRAYVASILWVWFVTPAFGAAVPPLWILAGLSIFVSMFQNWNVKPAVDPDLDTGMKTAISITMAALGPALCLLFGWVFHLLAGGA